MLPYCNESKVGIKLLKYSCPNIIACFLLFVVVINCYSVFKFMIFRYSSLFTCYHLVRLYLIVVIDPKNGAQNFGASKIHLKVGFTLKN